MSETKAARRLGRRDLGTKLLGALQRLVRPRFTEGAPAFFAGSRVRFSSLDGADSVTFVLPTRITMEPRIRAPRAERLRRLLPFMPTPGAKLAHFEVAVSFYVSGAQPVDVHERLRNAPAVKVEAWAPMPGFLGAEGQWTYVCVPRLEPRHWGMTGVEVDAEGMSFTFLEGRTQGEKSHDYRGAGIGSTHYRMEITDRADVPTNTPHI